VEAADGKILSRPLCLDAVVDLGWNFKLAERIALCPAHGSVYRLHATLY
jgi:hypothetical protein